MADATIDRSRALARRFIGELWVVLGPSYREVGLRPRLIRKLLDISAELGLGQATFGLVAERERLAINATESVEIRASATLKGRIRD